MKKVATITLIVLLLLCIATFIVYSWYQNAIFTPVTFEVNRKFEIKDGESLTNLLSKLESDGIILSEQAARIYIATNGLNPNIKTGNYSIPSGLNFAELIDLFVSGTFKSAVTITIPEGLRYMEIASILNSKFDDAGDEAKFSFDEFLDIASNSSNGDFSSEAQSVIDNYLPSGNYSLDGLLFPDTYQFNFDSTATQVIETLLLNFDRRIEEAEIVLDGQNNFTTIYEGVTLGAIIEREANASDDLTVISGIFHNRLNINFPLQADSTINYITGKSDPGVLLVDTKIDSPYNTYKYSGLTPTPINSPGIKAIEAAFEPSTTNYFYFLHDSSGQVHYAVTFEEHQANINQYL